MRVQIAYTVPVAVVVDNEMGEVVKVIVWDEEVQFDRDDCARDGYSITTDTMDEITDQDVRDKALAIATNCMWPAWQFGA